VESPIDSSAPGSAGGSPGVGTVNHPWIFAKDDEDLREVARTDDSIRFLCLLETSTVDQPAAIAGHASPTLTRLDGHREMSGG
jgi:hypothetical protein